jgi:pimeloyl-ACP methyl ester carboxylesterase
MIQRILLQLLLAGVLLSGGIAMFQDRLLYFPERTALTSLLATAQHDGLRAWPSADDFRGLIFEPTVPVRATLVVFHGNAGHAGDRVFYTVLGRLGIRVLLAEYPGYGPRPGTPGEETLVSDAAATVLLARREFPQPLLVAGESLGAGVAAAAYARVPEAVCGLWLITPWDRLASVASHHYPWLPVSLLLRNQYDSVAHLASARIPVAIVLAEADSIVPPHFGRHLYEQLSAPKRLWQVPGAGHNDWMMEVDLRWWSAVTEFLLGQTATAREPGRETQR